MSAENENKNNSYQRLTIEEFKKFEGCEHYTDEEAEEIFDALEQFTIIAFKLYQQTHKEE